MPRCAFLTLTDPTGYRIDDHLAVDALSAAGWQVDTIPWNAAGIDWAGFEAVVVRSTWDYHRHVDAFFETLERIQDAGPRVFNDIDIMRWNADKHYLADLAELGVSVVPTLYGRALERGDMAHFSEILESDHLVVKPVRGANAEGAFRIEASGPLSETILDHYRTDHFMVQPFVSSIQDEGEVSLFYFGGKYSHAIRKTPRRGDFRVQEEHGGTIAAWTPETNARAAGEMVMGALNERWPDRFTLYARVDLVRDPRAGEWMLMELEIIEPSMYYRMDDGAASRFVDAFENALR